MICYATLCCAMILMRSRAILSSPVKRHHGTCWPRPLTLLVLSSCYRIDLQYVTLCCHVLCFTLDVVLSFHGVMSRHNILCFLILWIHYVYRTLRPIHKVSSELGGPNQADSYLRGTMFLRTEGRSPQILDPGTLSCAEPRCADWPCSM